MQARHVVVVAAMVAAAGGVGFVIGRATTTPVAEDEPVADAPRKNAPPPRAVEHLHADKPRLERADDATTAGDALRKLVPDAPSERVADADARAAKIRLDAQARSDAADKIAAHQIAEEIAKERAFLADKERGGTMAMLRALRGSGAHPFELVGSPERFAPLFERKTSGPSIDGPTLVKEHGPIADGATITFPAGLCSWSVGQLGRGKPFPKDLLVVGAGMDATILRLDEFNADDTVASLTFRDLTIDCGDEYMFDLRSDNPVTLRLERCRVVGFDMGAGGSVMLSANTAAFFASDSRFEAGFGRNPGSGNLFRVRSGLLARMERCTFVGPFSSVWDGGADATYDFVDCTFENCGANFAARISASTTGVRFDGCTATDVAAAVVAGERLAFLSKVAAASGGTTDVLSLLSRYRQNLGPLVADRAAFVALFVSPASGPVVDGAAGKLTGPPPAAATVVFPAGAFDWDERERLRGFNGDLVLAGQGMDTTLVRLGTELLCGRLSLRDLTLDVGDHGGFPENSSRLAVIRIERCRVVGFDTGAGSETLFGSSGPTAVFAEDSRFETGYGRNPPDGYLFRRGEPTAARFERCVIRVPGDALTELVESDDSYVFAACRFLDVDPDAKRVFDKPPTTLVLGDCSVEYRAAGRPSRDSKLSLADVNPAWGDGRRK